MGPFGGECWFTVHSSLSWLFDPAFTAAPPSDSTFRLRWTRMTKLRHLFSDHVATKLSLLPTSVWPKPAVLSIPLPISVVALPTTESPVKTVPTLHSPDKTPPLLSRRRQCPKQLRRKLPLVRRISVSAVIGRSKRKKRKHRQRRMDFYRRYHRPPKAPRIDHISLVVTTVPDKHVNRSFGSSNSLDPPC